MIINLRNFTNFLNLYLKSDFLLEVKKIQSTLQVIKIKSFFIERKKIVFQKKIEHIAEKINASLGEVFLSIVVKIL